MNPLRRTIASALSLAFLPMAHAQPGSKDPAKMMKELRTMFLSASAASLGVKPTAEYPRVFGVAMDWPIGEEIATIVSLVDGTASLYTTSTFGIIGGIEHAPVRAAARRFVKAANKYSADGSRTSRHPYAAKDKIRFYLLGFNGLRTFEAPMAPIHAGKAKYSDLFDEGQRVLTELRRISERP